MSSVFEEKTNEVNQTQQKNTNTQANTQATETKTLQLPSFEEFKKRIESQGLYYPDKLLKIIYETIRVALEQHKVPAFLLVGPAGSGKTSLAQAIANALGAEMLFYQATMNASEDNVLYEYVPSSKSKSGVKVTYGILPRSLILSQKQPVVAVIDEIDKTRPSFDALFLDYLQNARVTTANKKILQGNPQNLIVFATSNNERDLSEPLTRRFTFIEVPPPTLNLVSKILHQYFNDDNLINKLLSIYVATNNLELRKPATIQELILAGKLLENGVDLNTVLNTHILKYPEDREKFYANINNPDIYKYKPQKGENINVVLQPIPTQPTPSTQPQNLTQNVQQTTNKEKETETVEENTTNEENNSGVIVKPTITTKKPEMEDITSKDIEVFADIEMTNPAEAVTHLIKGMGIYPCRKSDYIGPFRMVEDSGKRKIVCNTPLSLKMLYTIADSPTAIAKVDTNLWTLLYNVDPVEFSKLITNFIEKYNYLQVTETYYTTDEISYELSGNGTKIVLTLKKIGPQLYEAMGHITITNNGTSVNDFLKTFIMDLLQPFTLENIGRSLDIPYGSFKQILETLKKNNLLEPLTTRSMIVYQDIDITSDPSITEPKVEIEKETISNRNFIFNPHTGKLLIPQIHFNLKITGYYQSDNDEQENALYGYFWKENDEFHRKYGTSSNPRVIQVNSLDDALKEFEEAKRSLKEGEKKIQKMLKKKH